MPKPISEVIPSIIRRAAAKHETLKRLQRRWSRLVGKTMAAHTKPVRLRRGTLYVATDAPGASFLLKLDAPRLLGKLQEQAGCRIEELVIRAGDL